MVLVISVTFFSIVLLIICQRLRLQTSWTSLIPFLSNLGSHHTVAPQQQRRDLADGWRVAVIVAGQVPSAPAPVGDAVLAVVARAEDPVETEEEQNQQDARRQAQSCHPVTENERTLVYYSVDTFHFNF